MNNRKIPSYNEELISLVTTMYLNGCRAFLKLYCQDTNLACLIDDVACPDPIAF